MEISGYVVLFVFILGTVDFSAAEKPGEVALKKLLKEHSKFFKDENAKELKQLYTEDAVFVRLRNTPIVNNTAIKIMFEEIFSRREFIQHEYTIRQFGEVGDGSPGLWYVYGIDKVWEAKDVGGDATSTWDVQRVLKYENGIMRIYMWASCPHTVGHTHPE